MAIDIGSLPVEILQLVARMIGKREEDGRAMALCGMTVNLDAVDQEIEAQAIRAKLALVNKRWSVVFGRELYRQVTIATARQITALNALGEIRASLLRNVESVVLALSDVEPDLREAFLDEISPNSAANLSEFRGVLNDCPNARAITITVATDDLSWWIENIFGEGSIRLSSSVRSLTLNDSSVPLSVATANQLQDLSVNITGSATLLGLGSLHFPVLTRLELGLEEELADETLASFITRTPRLEQLTLRWLCDEDVQALWPSDRTPDTATTVRDLTLHVLEGCSLDFVARLPPSLERLTLLPTEPGSKFYDAADVIQALNQGALPKLSRLQLRRWSRPDEEGKLPRLEAVCARRRIKSDFGWFQPVRNSKSLSIDASQQTARRSSTSARRQPAAEQELTAA